MKKTNLLLIISITALLSGCGGGSSSTPAPEVISGLSTPDNVEIIQDDSATSASLAAVNLAAYNTTGTDYSDAKADTWINTGEWSEPLDMADMLMCIMKGTGGSQVHSATGETYNALVDMSQCDKQGGGSQAGKQTRLADVTITSTRPSNTAAHTADAYFSDSQDYDNNGTVTANEVSEYVAQTSITASPTTSNPFGNFTFNWGKNTGDAAKWDKGSLALGTTAGGLADFSFISKEKDAHDITGHEVTSWARGELSTDGSGGKLKVGYDHFSNAETPTLLQDTFKVRFNATHANVQKNTDTAVCYNLDETSMSTFVYGYNLYDNTSGALKDIAAGIQFVYDDAGTKDGRGYAGKYIDGNNVTKHWVWTSGNDQPTTIYKESDQTISYSIVWTGSAPTVGATFDDPIVITASYNDEGGNQQLADLNYEGPGQLWGIAWAPHTGDTNSNGQCDNGEYSCSNWKPAFNLADGTLLTDSNGSQWRVKQVGLWKEMATAASACAAIPVADADVAYTAPTLVETTKSWSDKPTPAITKARVIHGVKQF